MNVGQTQWANCRHLRNVFTRLCPVKMRLIAWKNNHAPHPVCSQFALIECFSEADIENARKDCIDAILRVLVRHHFCARWQPNAYQVGPGFCRFANQNGEARSRWKGGKGLPVNIFRTDYVKRALIWLVNA